MLLSTTSSDATTTISISFSSFADFNVSMWPKWIISNTPPVKAIFKLFFPPRVNIKFSLDVVVLTRFILTKIESKALPSSKVLLRFKAKSSAVKVSFLIVSR